MHSRELFLCVLLWVCFPLSAATTAEDFASPALGHQLQPVSPPWIAPGFSLPDLDEENHTLDQYRGQVIMLNFWASWCPPCRREMPSMEAVYKNLKKDGFVVLAVNEWEDQDHVFAFMGQLDVFPSFPILFDQQGSVAEAYDIQGLPTTLIIDQQGRVVYRAVGGRDFEHVEVISLLRSLLDKP